VPRERRSDVGELRARRAAGYAVHVVGREAERRQELERVESSGCVVVVVDEPARDNEGCQPADHRVKRGCRRIVRGRTVEQGQLGAAVEVGLAPEPEALVAARVPRQYSGPTDA